MVDQLYGGTNLISKIRKLAIQNSDEEVSKII